MCLGRLVRFLAPVISGYSPERALRSPYNYERIHRCHRFRYAAMGDVFHRWKLRFNQCRLHHAHRTCGTSHSIPSCLAAFPTCYFPLWVSPPGRLDVLEGHLPSTSCLSEAIRQAPKRRTIWYVVSLRHYDRDNAKIALEGPLGWYESESGEYE